MKLKILPLAILLTLLLTVNGFTQTQPESLSERERSFGIDVAKLYRGELVLELLEAAESTINAAVNEAYAEGYKAAMLEYAPGALTSKALAQQLQKELEAERKKNSWFWPAIGGSIGLSFVSGFFLHSLVSR